MIRYAQIPAKDPAKVEAARKTDIYPVIRVSQIILFESELSITLEAISWR